MLAQGKIAGLNTSLNVLFYNVDVFLFAHILQDFGPDGSADFAEMGFFEQGHKCSGLADAAANAQRKLVVDNALMVGHLEEVELVCQ